MDIKDTECKMENESTAACSEKLGHSQERMSRLERFAHSLVEREAKAKSILESAVDGIVIVSSQGIIESFNPAAEKIFGYAAGEAIGQKVNILMPEPHRRRHDQYIETYLRTGQKKIIGIGRETMARRKDGSNFPIELSISEVKLPDRSIFTGIIRDITARRQSASALKASEERFRLLVETMHDGLAVQDAQGKIIYVNPRFCEILGYKRDCLVGKLVSELMDSSSQIVFQNEISDQQPVEGDLVELNLEKDDGEQVSVRVSAKALYDSNSRRKGSFIMITDVTQIKKLQRQLLHSQKMEAVGRLAGGIAHDFNNLLTVIQGYVDLSLVGLEGKHPLYENLVQINEASKRAESLTRQLLAFSRKQVLQPKVLSLLVTIANLDQMLRRLIGEDISLVTRLDDSTGLIKADEGQIEQVIVNIVVNARDAMPHGGKLIIETRNAKVDEIYLGPEAEIPPGPYVQLNISDTGIGMDREVQSHIFEPFFTTKDVGQGTGLGLSTAYGIVKQSGGEIVVYSEPGQGTRFKIYLPRVDTEAAAPEAKTSVKSPQCSHHTILVVEDDVHVRGLIVEWLRRCGYKVLVAPDGPTALQRYAKGDKAVDLVLTDLVMPKMNGKEFADRFRHAQPGTRVLYMSGYTDDTIVVHGVQEADTPFIQKPFNMDALNIKIQEILEDLETP